MTDFDISSSSKQLTMAFQALANGRRRRLLGVVREHSKSSAPRSDVVTRLAAWSHDQPLESVTEDQHRALLADVHHVHIPVLTEAGLLEYDSDSNRLTPNSHPVYGDETVHESLTARGAADGSYDVVFDVLADRRRRQLLSALGRQSTPLDLTELATTVATAEIGEDTHDVPDAAVERIRFEFVQIHRPKLERAGLLEYDRDTNEITYNGHPDLCDGWLESELAELHQYRQAARATTSSK